MGFREAKDRAVLTQLSDGLTRFDSDTSLLLVFSIDSAQTRAIGIGIGNRPLVTLVEPSVLIHANTVIITAVHPLVSCLVLLTLELTETWEHTIYMYV